MSLDADAMNVAAPVSLEQVSGQVTLVEGSSFCLSGRTGDIRPGGSDGLFVLDIRVLSGWELRLDGQALEPLSVSGSEPFSATYVARGRPVSAVESTTLVVRRRWVGSGMRENLEVHNYDDQPAHHRLDLNVASDFADLFAVKAGRPIALEETSSTNQPLHALSTRDSVVREVRVTECPESVTGLPGAAGLTWSVLIPAKGTWQTCLEVAVRIDGHDVSLQYRCGQTPQLSQPAKRLAGWRQRTPALSSGDARLDAAIAKSVDDISSLVIEDPLHPESPVVAAGAPWFMALFGRDSLLTSYMTMIVDPGLAIGTLQTLARLQGKKSDPQTEEQPGRILHEVRFNSSAATDIDDGLIYYGTVDATPLFVMLIGELSRWGVDRSVVDQLMPHADRALEWIEQYGDQDGDGYVEYQRSSEQGLVNQGWKDSWDGINAADGALAQAPVALAEVQGYVYAAYLARADLAAERNDSGTCERYRDKAQALRLAFNRDFWVPEHGWYAIALDGHKNPVDSWQATWATACGRGSSTPIAQVRSRRSSSLPRCSADGGCGRSRRTCPGTTRSATTTARCGPTTARSLPPDSCATATSMSPAGSSTPYSTHPWPMADGSLSCMRVLPARSSRFRLPTPLPARRRHGRRRLRCRSCARCCASSRGLTAGS
jgi:glycogen debranching enzyme